MTPRRARADRTRPVETKIRQPLSLNHGVAAQEIQDDVLSPWSLVLGRSCRSGAPSGHDPRVTRPSRNMLVSPRSEPRTKDQGLRTKTMFDSLTAGAERALARAERLARR